MIAPSSRSPGLLRPPLRTGMALLAAVWLFCGFLLAGDRTVPGERRLPSKLTGTPHSTLLNINAISMWANDNGMLERNPNDYTAGVTYPRGTSTVIHAGGVVWGGRVRDGRSPEIRVGGQTFNQGTVPGRIIAPGIVENPENADVRVFRVRRDWATADLTLDASELFSIPAVDLTTDDMARIRDLYRRDWIEWPWQKGAPYEERNGLPGYQPDPNGTDPAADEPGLGGADQVIWFVTNDLNPIATSGLYGSSPIGLEDQVTCWAYNRIPELRQVIFQRHRLIYKGTALTPPSATVDSMYIAKWADPDVGNYGDDEVGYMPDRQVSYAYNATPSDAEFDKFRLVPPVVGYDFLEGPRVRSGSGSANWNLQTVPGYKNLPATTFTYFTAINRPSDYHLGTYQGTREWYNILRGYLPSPISPLRCIIDPFSNECTPFELTGDPELYAGWIDGLQEPPGDRRFAMASGPFTLAFGDTQEVIIGLVAATGKDNRNGIEALKTVDDAAQDAYKVNFNFPKEVPAPNVRVVELDQKLILDWESDTAQIRRTESFASRGYKFESYRVYQVATPTTPVTEGSLYQAFDPTAPRYLYLTEDKIRHRTLVNGQRYYFAVTAVAFNPDAGLARERIESPAILRTCVPHSPNPGTLYPYTINETVSDVQDVVGLSDATVTASYYDPAKPDGHVYKVLFSRSSDPLRDIDEKPRWRLIDSTANDTLVRDVLADSPRERVITRGFTIQVQLPVHGMKKVYQSAYAGQPSSEPIFNVPNSAGSYMIVAGGSSQIDTLKGETAADQDLELRFTGDSSWALIRGTNVPTSRWIRVPYTAWRVGLVRGVMINKQAYTALTWMGQDSIWRPTVLLDRAYNGRTLKTFYPITIINDSLLLNGAYIGGTYYDDAPTRADRAIIKAFVFQHSSRSSKYASVLEAYVADLDEDGVAAPAGTAIRFVRWKEVRNGDEKLFTPAALSTGNLSAATAELEKITVFPNPYYGFNRAELSRFKRFVTFSHLPRIATIRIFNLAGDLVRTIRKDDPGQFAEWDLNNENGLSAAGGLYLAAIELNDGAEHDLGTKTLKLMIVPEDQSPLR